MSGMPMGSPAIEASDKWMGIALIVLMLLLIGSLSYGFSCLGKDKAARFAAIQQEFSGPHVLRKLGTINTQESHTSGSFFLFFGSLDSSSSTKVNVKFAWQMNDGSYVISSVPVESIRVVFDERVVKPFVQFHIINGDIRADTIQQKIDRYVDYVTITCRSKDWPEEINMPLNTKTK